MEALIKNKKREIDDNFAFGIMSIVNRASNYPKMDVRAAVKKLINLRESYLHELELAKTKEAVCSIQSCFRCFGKANGECNNCDK